MSSKSGSTLEPNIFKAYFFEKVKQKVKVETDAISLSLSEAEVEALNQGLPDLAQPVAPRLYASDESIGGYDLAWIVIERFDHGPLGLHWHDDHVPRLVCHA